MIIAASLLAADPSRYGDEIIQAEQGGAEYLHLDVMDGRFVNNFSFSQGIISGLRKKSRLYFDAHLLIEDPLRHVQSFADAGADCITVHYEAAENLWDIFNACKTGKVDFGVALCPETPVELVQQFAAQINVLLILCVNPGFGGQLFIEESLSRIRKACALRRACNAGFLISVDGGINPDTAALCAEAGADILVSGTSIFGKKDRTEAIRALRNDA